MTQAPDDDLHDHAAPAYPPEADPDKAGDVVAAEIPGEQTDPTRRLTGGDQPEDVEPTP